MEQVFLFHRKLWSRQLQRVSNPARQNRCGFSRHRLRKRVYLVSPAGMSVAGEWYGLSDWMEYHNTLTDELKKMVDVPVVEILKTPAPKPFIHLWQRDTMRWTTFLRND
jgi:hypothetical protein